MATKTILGKKKGAIRARKGRKEQDNIRKSGKKLGLARGTPPPGTSKKRWKDVFQANRKPQFGN